MQIAKAKVKRSALPELAGDPNSIPWDVPRDATRTVLIAIEKLNKLYRLDDAPDGDGAVPIIIDDIPRKQ